MNDFPTPTPGCIKQAVSVVGNKWTALIVRELADGPKRFCELERALSLNPRTLTQRIDSLLGEAIIAHGTQNPKAYVLTTKGRDLLPILRAMAEWSAHYDTTTKSAA